VVGKLSREALERMLRAAGFPTLRYYDWVECRYQALGRPEGLLHGKTCLCDRNGLWGERNQRVSTTWREDIT
jgi:hypothetical protein